MKFCFPVYFFIRLPPEFLPVLGPLTRRCASTLGAALLCSSRVGSYIVNDTCHLAPCYLNGAKVFLLLSDRYRNPEQEFEPGT